MIFEQMEDCQEIVHWCASNLGRMRAENKTLEETVRACLNHISPHEETCINPNVVQRYVDACLA